MTHKKKNPAPLAKAAGSGIVAHGQAINTRKHSPSLAELQIPFIAWRSRLARIVAELAFDGRMA